jgi:hypothetical protein
MFLTFVRGRKGEWVGGTEAFNTAIETEECRKLGWLGYIKEKPAARKALTPVIEQMMHNEFRDIGKKKCGSCRTARVFFRVGASATHS